MKTQVIGSVSGLPNSNLNPHEHAYGSKPLTKGDLLKSLNTEPKVFLVTGAARRIGAEIVKTLHRRGHRVILHCRSSRAEAEDLCASLNVLRPESARCLVADLSVAAHVIGLAEEAQGAWGRIDGLVNNASVFYPTPLGSVTEAAFGHLLQVNLAAPFFLAQALSPQLRESEGSVVNIADVYGDRPLKDYPVYSVSKAALIGMTKALALEMAPAVRVNAVSPGAILWHEHPTPESERQKVLERIPLGGLGAPSDIAGAVTFLLLDAPYVSGQVFSVDGGRALTI